MQDDIKPVLTNEQLDAIHAAMQNYAACNINVFHFIARDVESEVLRVLADREGQQQPWKVFAQHQQWCRICAESVDQCEDGSALRDAAYAADAQRAKEPT